MQSFFKIGGIMEDRLAQQECFGSSPPAFNVSILDTASRGVGALRHNLDDVSEAPVGEKCELIVVSEGTARIGEGSLSFPSDTDSYHIFNAQSSLFHM